MLKISNLTKTYGEKKAVDNLSLSIKKGEICAFIGHNGAGKTTTIKAVCGILRPDCGEILIDGMDIAKEQNICEAGDIAVITAGSPNGLAKGSYTNLIKVEVVK